MEGLLSDEERTKIVGSFFQTTKNKGLTKAQVGRILEFALHDFTSKGVCWLEKPALFSGEGDALIVTEFLLTVGSGEFTKCVMKMDSGMKAMGVPPPVHGMNF